MANKKANPPVSNELNDEQLDQVAGGAINVFYEVPVNRQYWKYTCPACGISAVTNYWPECCNTCKEANITREEYKP